MKCLRVDLRRAELMEVARVAALEPLLLTSGSSLLPTVCTLKSPSIQSIGWILKGFLSLSTSTKSSQIPRVNTNTRLINLTSWIGLNQRKITMTSGWRGRAAKFNFYLKYSIPRENLEIAELISHPNYWHKYKLNDIALMRLKDPLDLAKHTPACFHSWKKWEPRFLDFFCKNS